MKLKRKKLFGRFTAFAAALPFVAAAVGFVGLVHFAALDTLSGSCTDAGIHECLYIVGAVAEAPELLTIDVYDDAANFNGLQTGWFAKVIKDKFNITVTVTAVSRLLKKMDSKN